MQTIALLVAVFGLLPGATTDEKKEPPKDDERLKCVVEQFDKAWGIKFKSMTAKDLPGKNSDVSTHTDIMITLDFTKDVSDVSAIRSVFAARGVPADLDKHPILFYLFDEDNVSIGKFVIMETEGELTGVKGDAFRIHLQIDKEKLKKAKRIEARLTTHPKPKE